MLKIDEGIVRGDYKKFVEKAEKLVQKNEIKEALTFIDTCARIAYNFNFTFTDERLELLVQEIGKKTLSKPSFVPVENRYVFYDFFGNTKVLTQQYIRALISWEVEFLYVLQDGENVEKSKSILDEISEYKGAKIVILEGKDIISKMKQLYIEVVEFKPTKVLLHTAPWDVMGVTVFTVFKQIDRYLINLTDHAFWLGKSCSDFVLEFRTYGYNLSYQARKIPKNNLLLQPYYPIQNEVPFEGFPLDTTGKVVGFSGASFYKIYGRNGKFLQMIKRVLEENHNFVFLMAGWGIDSIILKFIKDNNFENRFFLLKERKDIDQVFKNIDIFINTYPIIGGLMTQLAVANKRAIISYTTPDLSVNFIEDFLMVDSEKVSSIKDEDDFFNEINRLIRSADYRRKNIALYNGSIPTVSEFNNLLWENCNSPVKPKTPIPYIEIDYDALIKLYLEIDNDFLKLYHKLKLVNLKTLYLKYFPVDAIICSILILFTDSKTVKRNILDFFRKYKLSK